MVGRLTIEEGNRKNEIVTQLSKYDDDGANVVEHGSSSKLEKGKKSSYAPRTPSLRKSGNSTSKKSVKTKMQN